MAIDRSQESHAAQSPLRSKLIAEADLVMISPPPTSAVRRGGTRFRTRRRVLQVTSGTLLASGMAVAVLAWAPSARRDAHGAEPGEYTTTQAVAVPSKTAVTSPTTSGSTSRPTQDAYLLAADLGVGWASVGVPSVGPNNGLEMWLFSQCGTAGHAPPTPVRPMMNHAFANPQPNAGGNLIEGIYHYPTGTGPEVMATARAVLAKGCGPDAPESVPGVAHAGDDSLVYGLDSSRTILIRLGDTVAVAVALQGPGTMSDARVEEIQAAMLARLTAGQ